MSMLMNDTVKAISIGVLQQIDLDLCQCEQFAASEPIQGLEVILIHKGEFWAGLWVKIHSSLAPPPLIEIKQRQLVNKYLELQFLF